MNRAQILEILAKSKPALIARFGVTDLALFGSTVRDAARADSDVDILEAFDGPATSSMSDPAAREWHFCIDDMIAFARNAIASQSIA